MPKQFELFGNVTDVVTVDAKIDSPRLSKHQKKFNSLIGKINELKRQLVEWREATTLVQQKVASELVPLHDAYDQHRAELVRVLDRSFELPLFKKTDRKKLSYLICTIAERLVDRDFGTEMKMLHDKYSDISLDELKQEDDDFAKLMMEELLGIELPDDVDIHDEEQVQAFIAAKAQQEQEFRDTHENARKNGGQQNKTAKQQQREAQQLAEAQNVRKSLQDIFRKLVAALHPDREINPDARERKTELMQRVNTAYEKKDLLQLLELQLEVEQIDQSHMNQINDERLKSYVTILKEQCDELQLELEDIQMPYKLQFRLPPSARISVKDVTFRVNIDIADLKRDIADVQQNIQLLSRPTHLKAWLKEFRVPSSR